MNTICFLYPLLQIETVGPEGEKLLWIFLVLLLLGLFTFVASKKGFINRFSYSSSVLLSVEKNKIYHPTSILFNIENKEKKSIIIQNPVLRFKRGSAEKAFKIKSVNTSSIYPLYLEPGKNHELSVALQPFYDFDKNLKKYSRLRIEFNYNQQFKKSNYLLLKPTLFRKEKL